MCNLSFIGYLSSVFINRSICVATELVVSTRWKYVRKMTAYLRVSLLLNVEVKLCNESIGFDGIHGSSK